MAASWMVLPGLGGAVRKAHDLLMWEVVHALREVDRAVRVEPREMLTAGLTGAQRARLHANLTSDAASGYGKGIIPDLYVVSPLQTGTGELFDVKTMRRGCRSRQVPGGDVNYACTRVAVPTRCGAINRREAKVAAEYVNHANGLDRQFAGYTRERQRAGEVGPVASALASFGGATGLAFGKYGEWGPHVGSLLREIAKEHAARFMVELGCRTPSHARSVATQLLRRRWGMALLKANAAVAISNQAHLHGGHARTTAAASRGAGSRGGAAYAQGQASSGGISGAAWAAHDRGRD